MSPYVKTTIGGFALNRVGCFMALTESDPKLQSDVRDSVKIMGVP